MQRILHSTATAPRSPLVSVSVSALACAAWLAVGCAGPGAADGKAVGTARASADQNPAERLDFTSPRAHAKWPIPTEHVTY